MLLNLDTFFVKLSPDLYPEYMLVLVSALIRKPCLLEDWVPHSIDVGRCSDEIFLIKKYVIELCDACIFDIILINWCSADIVIDWLCLVSHVFICATTGEGGQVRTERTDCGLWSQVHLDVHSLKWAKQNLCVTLLPWILEPLILVPNFGTL